MRPAGKEYGDDGQLYCAGFCRRAVHQLFRLQQSGDHPRYPGGGFSPVRRGERAGIDDPVHSADRTAQSGDGIRLGQMDHPGPCFCPHVPDAGVFPRTDAGSLSDR